MESTDEQIQHLLWGYVFFPDGGVTRPMDYCPFESDEHRKRCWLHHRQELVKHPYWTAGTVVVAAEDYGTRKPGLVSLAGFPKDHKEDILVRDSHKPGSLSRHDAIQYLSAPSILVNQTLKILGSHCSFEHCSGLDLNDFEAKSTW